MPLLVFLLGNVISILSFSNFFLSASSLINLTLSLIASFTLILNSLDKIPISFFSSLVKVFILDIISLNSLFLPKYLLLVLLILNSSLHLDISSNARPIFFLETYSLSFN